MTDAAVRDENERANGSPSVVKKPVIIPCSFLAVDRRRDREGESPRCETAERLDCHVASVRNAVPDDVKSVGGS
jgi:hypothetical protein